MIYQEHILSNGLRIIMIPVHSFQSVSLGVFVKIGSRYEPETEAGISHFIEHMLFKGTHQRPTARLIAEAIEGVGGVSIAYTSQETTVYYAKVAASQVNTAIDVLTDMVRHPLFDAADVGKGRYGSREVLDMIYAVSDN